MNEIANVKGWYVKAMIKIGVWLPVYGSWLRSMGQAVKPDAQACLETAKEAERLGCDFVYASENLLNCIHGAEETVLDAWTLLSAIASNTTNISLVGAGKPGFRSPLLMARMIDTISTFGSRVVGLNVVCGWWQQEFVNSGVDWLDHDRRYDRAETFLSEFKDLFKPQLTEKNPSENNSRFVDVNVGLSEPNFPEIWISGHSERAKTLTAKFGKYLFLNGMSDNQLLSHINRCQKISKLWNKEIDVIVNGHVIATKSNKTARQRLKNIFGNADREKIALFRKIMEASGGAGWSGLTDEQMVDSNSGFEAGLVGSFSDVKWRLIEMSNLGISAIACQFDSPLEELEPFMREVVEPARSIITSNNSQRASL